MSAQGGGVTGNGSCGMRGVPPSAQRGFSLLELFVTLVLIVVLVTLYWGYGLVSHRNTQKKACQENLSRIYVALQVYANDFGGKCPVVPGALTSEEALDGLVPHYTVDTSIFICPSGRDPALPAGESFRNRKISYAYYMGWRLTDAPGALVSDRQINTLPKNTGDYAFSATGQPPGNNHHKNGGNFLFGDGHVEWSPPQLPFSLAVTQGVVLLNPKP
jgi:prepilin-type N-terminal cleavage/methylation domain-containing protein/prepilin-type processing-associated H-X9-DG protein